MPIGILGSLFVSVLFYISVAIVITLMVPYDSIDIASPLASAFAHHGNLNIDFQNLNN